MAYETKKALTRIEMLVALYQATIDTLRLIAATEADSSERFKHRLKALSLICTIESGVDPSYGELPRDILRLCEFVRHSLGTGSDDELATSIEVMQVLHSAFHKIMPEATALEMAGATSRLEMVSAVEIDA